jgi:hypothetical protein
MGSFVLFTPTDPILDPVGGNPEDPPHPPHDNRSLFGTSNLA